MKDKDMTVNNHFEAGAIVNHGQMNVGGGMIKVYKNGEENNETEDGTNVNQGQMNVGGGVTKVYKNGEEIQEENNETEDGTNDKSDDKDDRSPSVV